MKERELSLGRGRLPIRRTYDMGMAVAVAWVPLLLGGMWVFESLSVACATKATLNRYPLGHGSWHADSQISFVTTGLVEGSLFLASAWLLVAGASSGSGARVAWGVALGVGTFAFCQLAHGSGC